MESVTNGDSGGPACWSDLSFEAQRKIQLVMLSKGVIKSLR